MRVSEVDRELGMLSYMSESEPLRGRLRERISDFIVDEVLSGRRASRVFLGVERLEGSGSFHLSVLFKYTKLDWRELFSRVSREMGGRVGFAGMKDARSLSFQFISATRMPKRELRVLGAMLKYAGRGNWVSLGLNDGNHFTIVVRGVNRVRPIRRFPNFFSYQRFGVRRPYNHEIGRAIVLREIGEACDMIAEQGYEIEGARSLKQLSERVGSDLMKFYVHSYQSYLFNLLLSRRLEHGLSLEEGDFVLKESGAITTYPERGDLLLPIPGAFTRAKGGWLHEELDALMRKEGLSREIFLFRELPEISALGDFRRAVCEADYLRIVEGSNFVTLSFFLESGSYATSYLRELMKPEDPVGQGFL
ncbi:MAG: tRNA pseudouridine(13) synthase TruD [Candidatus Korarchaeum sp.]|nr:tRNA pseudouridine(13) synthase TruD [Candidatus Korarchaeum sp.]MDW8035333.1 tRNA pseudouridine(13) synthase TruD [Candidatus Korarchaeum sp.]